VKDNEVQESRCNSVSLSQQCHHYAFRTLSTCTCSEMKSWVWTALDVAGVKYKSLDAEVKDKW